MSNLSIRPCPPLRGAIRVPGDKSISPRALLLGAIATGIGRVEGFLPAVNCLVTLRAVRRQGLRWKCLRPRRCSSVGAGCRDCASQLRC